MTTHSAINNRLATGHTIRRMTVKSSVPRGVTSICSVPRTRQTIMRFDLRCLSKVRVCQTYQQMNNVSMDYEAFNIKQCLFSQYIRAYIGHSIKRTNVDAMI